MIWSNGESRIQAKTYVALPVDGAISSSGKLPTSTWISRHCADNHFGKHIQVKHYLPNGSQEMFHHSYEESFWNKGRPRGGIYTSKISKKNTGTLVEQLNLENMGADG